LNEETVMLANLVWRAALLGAVFATDLVVFIGLCRDELRQQSQGGKQISKGVSASPLTSHRASRGMTLRVLRFTRS
jgi:hypothetical protein